MFTDLFANIKKETWPRVLTILTAVGSQKLNKECFTHGFTIKPAALLQLGQQCLTPLKPASGLPGGAQQHQSYQSGHVFAHAHTHRGWPRPPGTEEVARHTHTKAADRTHSETEGIQLTPEQLINLPFDQGNHRGRRTERRWGWTYVIEWVWDSLDQAATNIWEKECGQTWRREGWFCDPVGREREFQHGGKQGRKDITS